MGWLCQLLQAFQDLRLSERILMSACFERFARGFLFLFIVGIGVECQAKDQLGRENPSLKRRLLEEGPDGWAKLKQFSRHVAASATQRHIVKDRDGNVVHELDATFSIYTNGEWERQDYAYSQTGWVPKSQGVGPKYGFAVARNSKTSPYAVYYLGELDASGDDQVTRKELDNGQVRAYLEMPWNLGIALDDLLRDQNFSLKSVTPVSRHGEMLVRMEFDWPHAKEPEYPTFVGGSILLAPDDYWAIRECDLRGPGRTTRMVISYDHTAEGVPILRKIERTSRFSRDETLENPEEYDGYVKIDTFTFDKYEYKEVPPETFTLTAFGLPERQVGTNWTAWLLIALGVLATAVSLYILYRRRATTA